MDSFAVNAGNSTQMSFMNASQNACPLKAQNACPLKKQNACPLKRQNGFSTMGQTTCPLPQQSTMQATACPLKGANKNRKPKSPQKRCPVRGQNTSMQNATFSMGQNSSLMQGPNSSLFQGATACPLPANNKGLMFGDSTFNSSNNSTMYGQNASLMQGPNMPFMQGATACPLAANNKGLMFGDSTLNSSNNSTMFGDSTMSPGNACPLMQHNATMMRVNAEVQKPQCPLNADPNADDESTKCRTELMALTRDTINTIRLLKVMLKQEMSLLQNLRLP